MRKILLVILTIFLSVITYSQKIQYIGLPDNTVEVRNKLKINSLKDATGDSVMIVDDQGNVKLKAITDFSGSGGSEYSLPTASSTTLGGIKIGSGLSIDENGILSIVGGSSNPDSLYLQTPIYSKKELNDNGDSIQVIKFRNDSLPELRYAADIRDTTDWEGNTLVDVDYINSRIANGTYTPTITNVNGVSSSTPVVCNYSRNGNIVTVSGQALVVLSNNSGGNVVFKITLPVPRGTGFSSDYGQVGGSGMAEINGSTYTICSVNASISSTDSAVLEIKGDYTDGTTAVYSFQFEYRLN